jgi:hypothetical protein
MGMVAMTNLTKGIRSIKNRRENACGETPSLTPAFPGLRFRDSHSIDQLLHKQFTPQPLRIDLVISFVPRFPSVRQKHQIWL